MNKLVHLSPFKITMASLMGKLEEMNIYFLKYLGLLQLSFLKEVVSQMSSEVHLSSRFLFFLT